jgi:hypothetical protein
MKPQLNVTKKGDRFTVGKCTCGENISFTAPLEGVRDDTGTRYLYGPDPLGETLDRLREAFERHLIEKHDGLPIEDDSDWMLERGED